jgi:hypothetical protein
MDAAGAAGGAVMRMARIAPETRGFLRYFPKL